VSAATRLEDLAPGARVSGVLPNMVVEVVQTEWHGTEALTLTYRDDGGRVDHQLLYRGSEGTLKVEGPARTWSFDGDGRVFRLASEALRIRLAHLFDPYLAVHTSNIDPLPHRSVPCTATCSRVSRCVSSSQTTLVPEASDRAWTHEQMSAETLVLATGLATVAVTGVGVLVTLKSVRDQLWLQMFSEYTRRYQ
jgi:hypothetical protein